MNGMLDLPPLVGMKVCVNPERYKKYTYKELIKGSGRIVDLAGLDRNFFQRLKKRLECGETPSAYVRVLFDNGQKLEIYYRDMLLLDEPCTDLEVVKIRGYDEFTIATEENKKYADKLVIEKGKELISQRRYDKEWRLENLYGCGDNDEAKDYIERNI